MPIPLLGGEGQPGDRTTTAHSSNRGQDLWSPGGLENPPQISLPILPALIWPSPSLTASINFTLNFSTGSYEILRVALYLNTGLSNTLLHVTIRSHNCKDIKHTAWCVRAQKKQNIQPLRKLDKDKTWPRRSLPGSCSYTLCAVSTQHQQTHSFS